jgi:hypothetical protein
MSNFPIFSAQAVDGDSVIFKISPREGVGISDTDYSAYFEIFGSLGGGTLSLQKECIDGTYREAEQISIDIAADFPSSGKVLLQSFNFKDQSNWKFVLAGSTTPSLTITGINMKGTS